MILKAAVLASLLYTNVATAALIIVAIPEATNSLTFQTAPAETNLHLMFEGSPSELSNSIQFSYSSNYTFKAVDTPNGWSLLTSENASQTSYASYFFSGFSSGDPAEYHDLVQPVAFQFSFEAKTPAPAEPILVNVEVKHALFSPLFGLATTQQSSSLTFNTVPMPVAIPEPSQSLLISVALLSVIGRRSKVLVNT